jgi:hypothetical protein
MGPSKHPEQVRQDAPSPIQITGVEQVDRAANAYRGPVARLTVALRICTLCALGCTFLPEPG